MEIIRRQEYLDKIEKVLGKGAIVVLTGQRRVGKSYMLKQLCEDKRADAMSNVIYIDKEKREFDSIRNYQDLNSYIEAHRHDGVTNYILIDEVSLIYDKTQPRMIKKCSTIVHVVLYTIFDLPKIKKKESGLYNSLPLFSG